MWNKKGVSTVVATLLIVLITIAAAALLISTILPFIQNSLSSSTACVPYQATLKIDKETGYNCYDSNNLTGFSVRVSAPKGDVEELDRFEIVFGSDGSSRKISIINGNASSSGVGGVRMLNSGSSTILVPKPGELMTYVYNSGNSKPERAEIYPVLKNGKICDKSDEVRFVSCKGVVL